MNKGKGKANTSRKTSFTDMSISEWQTLWMQDIGDILIRIVEQNGCPTLAPLRDIFERGVVICDLSQHNPTQTLGMRATKELAGLDRGKDQMMEESIFESD
ncbi:hypothetical protein GOBAR_DD28974 [Gossypium barbadense]|nr:hypothetical protein GOBAR_DD28974 [Gossypium barbadense]